jgi:hypothetical protein
MVVAGILAATGFTLIVTGVRNEHRSRRGLDLAERLLPNQPSVADEAEVWLRRQ